MSGLFVYGDERPFDDMPQAGFAYTVLDCSNGGKGVALDASGRIFEISVPARAYPAGVKITVTDRSHRSAVYVFSKPFTLAKGGIVNLPKTKYAPASDLVFAEHFDAFVFGGDRMGGKGCDGFNPVSTNCPLNGLYNGTERPAYVSNYMRAGSEYIHTEYKTSIENYRRVSLAYIDNRNIRDWGMMFRAQEYAGYLGVGVAENLRGCVETPKLALEGICEIEVRFRFCPQAKATSNVLFHATNAGVIREYELDGVRRTLNDLNYPYIDSASEVLRLKNEAVGVPKSEAACKEWHDVRLVVSGATAETTLKWISEHNETEYVNGFFIDDIEVRLLSCVPRGKTLRVVDYNIQNGMWADQGNDYANFVEYMKSIDADVVIFCEAQSNYVTGEDRRMPEPIADRYLPAHWGEFAARWGHGYWAIGAHQDNHPVVITSKYPVTLVQKLGGSEVSHGGIHAQVTVGGERVNFVGFHTYPKSYARDIPEEDKEGRERSTRNFDGEKFRMEEMKLLMERTILDPKYAAEKNWLIMGDTNCLSPLDDRYFEHGKENPRYWGHNYMLRNIPCSDIVKTYCCPEERDVMISTIQGKRRIDIMYGTEPMMRRVIRAKTPKEGFTRATKRAGFRFHEGSSDHLPVIVDFRWE